MIGNARRWRVLAYGMAAGVAGVAVAVAGAPASAQTTVPPQPSPSTVTQPLGQTTPGQAQLGQTALTAPVAQSGLSTPPVGYPVPSTVVPATSGTLFDYFHEKGVTLEPQNAHDFRALNIVLPLPRGWSHVPDPNVPDAFAVIADRVGGNGLYTSNAQVKVYKLIGEFDPKEAISHGFVDSQQLPAWRTTDGSISEFGGMPSSVIEGTYRENSMTLNTSRRHVIASTGAENYLVSLFVTTSVDQVVPAAEATDAIVRGFRVSVPTPAPTSPAPPSPAVPAPASPGTPLGLPG